MAYLSQLQLEALNFKKLGKNVKISDKASIYNTERIEIADNSRIDDFCVISGKVTIGAFVHIAAFCLIAGGEKGVSIGDFSGISYGSRLFSQSDDYSGQYMVSPLVPIDFTNVSKAEVHIGRHAIIGAGSVVFPGVHIGEGCSIGAMSLVTKNAEPWGIYVGIPAKRIKEKSKNILVLEEEFLKTIVCEEL